MPSRGQTFTVYYFAFNTSTKQGQSSDAANHTLVWAQDGVAAAPLNAPFEVDGVNAPGLYALTLDVTETQCSCGALAGTSSTGNVLIEPTYVPFEYLPAAAPGTANGLLVLGENTAGILIHPPDGEDALKLLTADPGVPLFLQTTGTAFMLRGATGIDCLADSGPGASIRGNSAGLTVAGDAGHGATFEGGGNSGNGIYAIADKAGFGIRAESVGATGGGGIGAFGSGSGGFGIQVLASHASGIGVQSVGGLEGVRVQGVASPGVRVTGGTVGMYIQGASTSPGLQVIATGTGPGVQITGNANAGLSISGTTGGISVSATTGPGVNVTSASNTGLNVVGSTGIAVTGSGTGGGVSISSIGGHGLVCVGGGATKHGAVFTRGGANGDDVFLTNSDAPTLRDAILTADSINANVLAADAVAEVQAGLATAAGLTALQAHGDANWGGGSSDDPLANQPSDYEPGEIGYIIGRIGTAEVVVTSPLAAGGDLELVKGDSYSAALGRELVWSSGDWPPLNGTDGTITMEVDDGRLIVDGAIVDATTVSAEPTSADTNALGQGVYSYCVVYTLDGERCTLVSAKVTVVDREDT